MSKKKKLKKKFFEKSRPLTRAKMLETAKRTAETSDYPNPKTHIGATLAWPDGTIISSPNNLLYKMQPESIKEKVGGSSMSAHAEVRAFLKALKESGKPTEGAVLTVTDPLCPNCMKMAVAAGIKEINFDQAGKNKKWYEEHKDDFDKLSLAIATKAGVSVNALSSKNNGGIKKKVLNKKDLKTEPNIIDWSKYELTIEPFEHEENTPIDEATQQIIARRFGKGQPYAATVARKGDGTTMLIAVPESQDIINDIGSYKSDKYNQNIHAINHLMMVCARVGAKPGIITASQIPTAREVINLCEYADENHQVDLQILDPEKMTRQRHHNGSQAISRAMKHGIISSNVPFYEEEMDLSEDWQEKPSEPCGDSC